MLTCWIVAAGFLTVLGVGGFLFEKSKLAQLVDHLTKDLPMNWAELRNPIEE